MDFCDKGDFRISQVLPSRFFKHLFGKNSSILPQNDKLFGIRVKLFRNQQILPCFEGLRSMKNRHFCKIRIPSYKKILKLEKWNLPYLTCRGVITPHPTMGALPPYPQQRLCKSFSPLGGRSPQTPCFPREERWFDFSEGLDFPSGWWISSEYQISFYWNMNQKFRSSRTFRSGLLLLSSKDIKIYPRRICWLWCIGLSHQQIFFRGW